MCEKYLTLPVRPAWFEDPAVRDMFFRRLDAVKKEN